jgi:Domain of unknown function (DUF6089)
VRYFLIIVIHCCLGYSLTAQKSSKKFERSKEIGLLAGTAYYLGDINPYKHFGGRLKACGGMTYRQNFDRRWTVKGSMLMGVIEAWDIDSKNQWQLNRNLHFRNQVIEGSLQFELNFIDYQIGNSAYPWSPYLFAGIGYFQMKPMANFKGTWYELQPLGTEGQGTPYGAEKYKTGLMSVPFGAGIKTNIWAIFGFSLEWGVRKTWTDYFDDVSTVYVNPELLEDEAGSLAARLSDPSLGQSIKDPDGDHNGGMQRGDPGRKDYYFFITGSLNIRIDKKANSCWK